MMDDFRRRRLLSRLRALSEMRGPDRYPAWTDPELRCRWNPLVSCVPRCSDDPFIAAARMRAEQAIP